MKAAMIYLVTVLIIIAATWQKETPAVVKIYKDKPVSHAKAEYIMDAEISAYCPCEKCCGVWSDGLTFMETDAYLPGVAVDPDVIPLGSILYVQGHGRVVADDIGGAIKGSRIDLRFPTHQEALEWGRQTRKVKVWNE